MHRFYLKTNIFGSTKFPVLMLGILTLFLQGCNSASISTPQIQALDPAIERARHKRHDPLPLGDLGPETFTRGRDYFTPRNYPRRAQENYSRTIDPAQIALYSSYSHQFPYLSGYCTGLAFKLILAAILMKIDVRS